MLSNRIVSHLEEIVRRLLKVLEEIEEFKLEKLKDTMRIILC